MGDTIETLIDAIRNSGLEIRFGLKAQGHIPTIERMLSEGRSWEDIGREIGWCPETARKWYERTEIAARGGREGELRKIEPERPKPRPTGIPDGWRKVPGVSEVFLNEQGDLVILGTPADEDVDPEPPTHSCDAMGCGTLDHVLVRARLVGDISEVFVIETEKGGRGK